MADLTTTQVEATEAVIAAAQGDIDNNRNQPDVLNKLLVAIARSVAVIADGAASK